MDLELREKVAIVTGGSTGTGAEVTKMLAAEGCNVLVNYIVDEEETLEFVKRVNDTFQTSCVACYGDISKFDDVKHLFSKAIESFGKIDIVVNSAALLTKQFVKDMTEEQWRKSVDVNFTGAFFIDKCAIDYFLMEKKEGRIINLVSQSAFNGTASGHAHYAASKAGVVGLTISLAREVSNKGINVNCVAPGIIWTPLSNTKVMENIDHYLETIPIGRVAMPIDIARVVIFLASSLGSYLTGATIDASGGMMMR